MTNIMVIAILFLIFMFLGVPVAFSIGVPCVVWVLFLNPVMPATIIAQNIMGYMLSFTLISMPGFLFVGRMMNTCGVTDRLFKLSVAIVGRWRGGLAHSNALTSMMFASMSGTAIGDAGGLGLVEMKMMKDAGYAPDVAAGITAASSILGPIIPPSAILVFLGAIAEVSVASLFFSGIVPGVLMAAALMINVAFRAKFTKKGKMWPKTPVPWKQALKTIPPAIPSLLTFVVILGSIMAGICTPTEAAILAVWYALMLGICYKKINLKSFWNTVLDTVDACGVFMLIISVASVMAWIITIEGLPSILKTFMVNFIANGSVNGLLLLCGLIFLVVGCFLDTGAAVLLLAPILMPVVSTLGINPIHFAMIMTIGLMIGIITPPFGICLFVVSEVGKVPVKDVTREAIRYLPAMIAVLLLITFFPEIVIWLPRIAGLSVY